MAARKVNKTKSQNYCSFQTKLHTLSRCFITISCIMILVAYLIRKLGYLDYPRDGTTDREDGKQKGWFSFWSNDTKTQKIQDQFPTLFIVIDIINSFWIMVFDTVDHILISCKDLLIYLIVVFKNQSIELYKSTAITTQHFASCIYYQDFKDLSDIDVVTALLGIVIMLLSVALYCIHRRYASRTSEHCESSFVEDVRSPRRGEGDIPVVPRRGVHVSCTMRRALCILLVVMSIVSFPWEFIRIYQHEVAKRAAITLKGSPAECMPESMSLWQSMKTWFRMTFSWSHDPCEEYHRAVLVDPLWEVTPLMVVSSLVTRCITTPLHTVSSAIGASIRALMNEIPTQWQPVFIAVILILMLFTVLATCRYRLVMPFFIRIEPSHKTPIIIKTCGRSKCVEAAKEKYKDRQIMSIERYGRGDMVYDEHDSLECSMESDS